MFRYLNKIIENEIREANLDFYSVIIGTKPSMGARSPKLWKKVYKYDDNRNQIEDSWYNSDGSLRDKRTFKYEYDSKGNWTKCVSFLTQSEIIKPYQIAERKIEYYD